ncbi:hypothetical protein [Ancylobacter polymorphus]|uniref:Antitoxin n=1 Tax=Ancylobacter polymorphus TaxID=223390 RepID=A0ABU0BH38_9HYPH|nr:hypothetical protein [Ancylobacter polymorphus]MDQ0303789.1 hypothetical protein [Ancylobacter polymorphus]
MAYIPIHRKLTLQEYSEALDEALTLREESAANWIRAHKFEYALRAIIDRADNGTLGSSKVQDMRKLAEEALGE